MRGEKSTYMGGRMVSARRGFSIRHVRWIDLDWHVLLIALALFGVGMMFQRAMAMSDFELGHDGIRFESHLKKVVVARWKTFSRKIQASMLYTPLTNPLPLGHTKP